MERRGVHLREGLVGHGRRTICRKRLAHLGLPVAAHGLQACPAPFVRRHEVGVVVKLLDLPDASLPGILVLVEAIAPGRVFLELAEEGELAPAPLRCAAVGADVHDGLQLHVVIELSVRQTGAGIAATFADQPFQDACLAHVHAIDADFHGGIVREQIRSLVPVSLVDVVAVGTLELFDLIGVFQPLRVGRHGGKPSFQCLRLRGDGAAQEDCEHQEARHQRGSQRDFISNGLRVP